MSFGFKFRETMSGTFHFLAAPTDERAMSFTVAVTATGLRSFIKAKVARIAGEVDVEGFADRRALDGTLAFRILDERRLPYEFTFKANDGKGYRFRGQKDFSMLALEDSITVLPASVYDEAGKEIGRAMLRFNLRGDLEKLLRSFRLTH